MYLYVFREGDTPWLVPGVHPYRTSPLGLLLASFAHSRYSGVRFCEMAARKLSSLTGFDKFQIALNAEGTREMRAWFRSKKRARLLIDEVHKDIFDLGPPTPPVKPTPRSRYFQKVNGHVLEILRATDTMRDIEFYAGRFPYRKTTISKHRHLQFHIEAFLHEIYSERDYVCSRPSSSASTEETRVYRKSSSRAPRSRRLSSRL
jgi:hypothetical protein